MATRGPVVTHTFHPGRAGGEGCLLSLLAEAAAQTLNVHFIGQTLTPRLDTATGAGKHVPWAGHSAAWNKARVCGPGDGCLRCHPGCPQTRVQKVCLVSFNLQNKALRLAAQYIHALLS